MIMCQNSNYITPVLTQPNCITYTERFSSSFVKARDTFCFTWISLVPYSLVAHMPDYPLTAHIICRLSHLQLILSANCLTCMKGTTVLCLLSTRPCWPLQQWRNSEIQSTVLWLSNRNWHPCIHLLNCVFLIFHKLRALCGTYLDDGSSVSNVIALINSIGPNDVSIVFYTSSVVARFTVGHVYVPVTVDSFWAYILCLMLS